MEKSLDSVSRLKYFNFDLKSRNFYAKNGGLTVVSFAFLHPKLNNPMNETPNKMSSYWKKNLRTLLILLFVWFVVSFGFGIILVEQLNQYHFGGYPLGFWFAQQGAIYCFIVLIFIYVIRMNLLDREFGVHED
jgi:putative solute:sodium symporter small subunit